MNSISINKDALSHGQIKSKIWLVENLENMNIKNPVIWVLGGWYGLLPFIIFSRGKINPARICSFDIDPNAKAIAERFNDAWMIPPEKLFYPFETDVLKLEFSDQPFGPSPDIIINTACEHFSMDWLSKVPAGSWVALQSTDMEHIEHTYKSTSLADFKLKVGPVVDVKYEGTKNFKYLTFEFNRYMIIGQKV